jgi:hypothetical protein
MDIETNITNANIIETHVVIRLLDLKIYLVTHSTCPYFSQNHVDKFELAPFVICKNVQHCSSREKSCKNKCFMMFFRDVYSCWLASSDTPVRWLIGRLYYELYSIQMP